MPAFASSSSPSQSSSFAPRAEELASSYEWMWPSGRVHPLPPNARVRARAMLLGETAAARRSLRIAAAALKVSSRDRQPPASGGDRRPAAPQGPSDEGPARRSRSAAGS